MHSLTKEGYYYKMALELSEGDVVRLVTLGPVQLKNYGVRNGDLATVRGRENHRLVLVKLKDGALIRVPVWRIEKLSALERLALEAE